MVDEQYDGPERRNGWHFNKSINVGNIFTVVLLFSSVIIYAKTIEQRVAVMESSMQLRRESNERADKYLMENVMELRADMATLNSKVDRLIENHLMNRK